MDKIDMIALDNLTASVTLTINDVDSCDVIQRRFLVELRERLVLLEYYLKAQY